jgi:hypothetical protein
MSRLIVQMQISIDGFVSSSIPGSTWQLWDWGPNWTWSADVSVHFNALFEGVRGILLSRPKLAEGYLDHWYRVADQHPDDANYRFVPRVRELPKFVVTQHSVDASWANTTVVSTPLADGVLQAKTAAKSDVVCFGGAGFVNALLRHDLVDELQLYVNPGVAGEGSRIFDRTMATEKYQLANAIPTTCGILIGCWTKWRQSQDAEAGNAS